MWILGVGAVYKLPQNVRHVGESNCFQKKSAEVRIPCVQGGLEARLYIRLAL